MYSSWVWYVCMFLCVYVSKCANIVWYIYILSIHSQSNTICVLDSRVQSRSILSGGAQSGHGLEMYARTPMFQQEFCLRTVTQKKPCKGLVTAETWHRFPKIIMTTFFGSNNSQTRQGIFSFSGKMQTRMNSPPSPSASIFRICVFAGKIITLILHAYCNFLQALSHQAHHGHFLEMFFCNTMQ